MKLPWCALAIIFFSPLAWGQNSPLVLKDGDRVVFVGSELVELDAQYGYFETMLQARFSKAHFTFRNLGWSGDTVWGEARAEFGTQQDGYQKLVDEVISAKPTVLFIAYGVNESFAGNEGIPAFTKQYEKLLDDLAKTKAKVWLIGPNPEEDLGPPLPDPAEHNKSVAAYSLAISELASARKLGYITLLRSYHSIGPGRSEFPTDDELHFNDQGYLRFGRVLVEELCGLQKNSPRGAPLESLRHVINQKNRTFFYRWRPENDTYIFGFRKAEQGRNAVEIPQFDPIVQKLEKQIDDAKQAMMPATNPAK